MYNVYVNKNGIWRLSMGFISMLAAINHCKAYTAKNLETKIERSN